MKKIYLSGAISGRPFEEVQEQFHEAELNLTEKGNQVINPLNNGLSKFANWEQHMRADIKMMLDCDTIYMLKGWNKSKGARMEKDIAEKLSFDIVIQK